MDDQEILAGKLREWVHVLMRNSMHGFIRYSKESGLSMPQMTALFRIRRDRQCGVTEIGEHLGITSAAASQMLERLVKQGYVDRSEDPEDRRGKKLALTETGDKVVKEGLDARQGWLSELAARFEGEESLMVARALDLLVERTRDLSPAYPHECSGSARHEGIHP